MKKALIVLGILTGVAILVYLAYLGTFLLSMAF